HLLPGLDTRRQVLMAMTPGDQHYFGASMVERFLSAAGWGVETAFDRSAEDIAQAAHAQWFAVAGLTVGSERSLPRLEETIRLIRRHSRNQMIAVMVGGPLFTADPARALEVGADGTAANAPAAVLMAQKLFDEIALKIAD
ncbi:MAG: cobalamin B12-binding domain-containing protein, partial [Novosphingobium sp.]|nr:cobalamin B12-binding domain-containing protein [Novosphingobium sp.]